MSGKEQLYYLLKHVKIGDYDINTFCDLFTNIFNLETDKSTLELREKRVFAELEKYTCRFSPYEEDLKIPNAFYDEKVIKEQIDIAIERLGIWEDNGTMGTYINCQLL